MPATVAAAAAGRRPAVKARALLVLLPVALTCAEVGAQGAQGAPGAQRSGFDVASGVSLSQYWSDNRNLSTTDRQAEWLTVVSPNVRVAARTELLRGFVDYSLQAYASSADSGANDVRHALAASLVAEPIRRVAFIDLRSSITQQSISAYGVQSGGPRAPTGNQSEVRSVVLSPYLVGSIPGIVDLEARVTFQRTDAQDSSTGDKGTRVTSLRAGGGRTALRWALSFSDDATRFDGGRSTSVERLEASLSWMPHYDWRLTGRLGREKADVLTLEPERRRSWGVGANWTPSPRTQVDATYDERYFGRSYRLLANYRTPRTVWRLSVLRDATTDNQFGADAATAREYDRLYALLTPQIDDPVQRDLAVRQLLGNRSGVLTGAISLQRRYDASAQWTGLRAIASLGLYRSTTSRLDRLSNAQDDLTTIDRLNQNGIEFTLGYRLAGTSRANLSVSRQQNTGRGVQASNRMQTINLSWSEQLWAQAALTASLRRTSFHSGVSPYTENGASATFSLRF